MLNNINWLRRFYTQILPSKNHLRDKHSPMEEPPPRPDLNVQKGDNLIFLDDVRLIALISWTSSTTSGHEITVPTGTKVRVPQEPVSNARGFGCVPIEYDEFGIEHIPEHYNKAPKYVGYHLVVMKSELGNRIQRIVTNA